MSTYKQPYTLYGYQQVIYDEIPRRLRDRGVIVQSPPRSGKSKIIDSTVQRIIKAGKIAVVLTHRDKIQKQLIDHCDGISIDAKVDHVFIAAGHCYVAMLQTIIKRPSILSQLLTLGNNVVLLIDECHDGSFNKIMDALPEAHRIGFTATPVWKWAKFLPRYYKSIITGPQISELIKQGRFVPVDYHEMVSDLDGLKESAGKYTEQSQDIVFGRSKIYDGLFDELKKFTFNKCAIFCASKKSADKLFDQFKAHPQYRVGLYYSGLPSYNLAKFTDLNEVNILITVRSLGTGWDYPPLDMLVGWCAMTSLISYLQIFTRNCTPHPGKARVTSLDFGGNNSRFGGGLDRIALTMDRDWNALWQPPPGPERAANGVAAQKICVACEYMCNASARSCPNCGYIWPESEVALKVGELVRIEEEVQHERAVVKQMAGRRISTLSATELAAWVKQKDKRPFGMRVAKSRALQDSTFPVEYAAAIGYKPGWADRVLQTNAEALLHDPEFTIQYQDILVY